MTVKVEKEIAGRTLTIETGRVARQAGFAQQPREPHRTETHAASREHLAACGGRSGQASFIVGHAGSSLRRCPSVDEHELVG